MKYILGVFIIVYVGTFSPVRTLTHECNYPTCPYNGATYFNPNIAPDDADIRREDSIHFIYPHMNDEVIEEYLSNQPMEKRII